MFLYIKFLTTAYICSIFGTVAVAFILGLSTTEVLKILPAMIVVPLTYGLGYTIFGSIAGFLYLKKELKSKGRKIKK